MIAQTVIIITERGVQSPSLDSVDYLIMLAGTIAVSITVAWGIIRFSEWLHFKIVNWKLRKL